jgi:hypothetical protein
MDDLERMDAAAVHQEVRLLREIVKAIVEGLYDDGHCVMGTFAFSAETEAAIERGRLYLRGEG